MYTFFARMGRDGLLCYYNLFIELVQDGEGFLRALKACSFRCSATLRGSSRSAPPCGASLTLTAFCRYAYSFVTKRVPEKSRQFRGARLAAKTMAAIQQSWPARVLQSPTGALIASQPHSHGLRARGSLRERVGKAAASRALKNLTKVGLAAARRRFLYGGTRSH